jgi:uncharacterized membrane protein
LEQSLGKLLQYGTVLASTVVALGVAIAPDFNQFGMRTATAGIALFILLPVARVAVMLFFFLQARDYRFGAIAALVLATIFLGFFLGVN